MSKRARRARQAAAAASPTSTKSFMTTDSFNNFISRTGIGTPNQSTAATYGFNPVSRNRTVLEWAYRGSWICGMAVDSIAEDMTREGVEIQGNDSPEQRRELEDEARRLDIWGKLQECIKWSRLYGGAIGYIMVKGQNPATPLRPETIGKDQFQGIMPLDRWVLQPSLHDLVRELTPDFGKPKFYDVMADGNFMALPKARIHYSRVIRFEGTPLPYFQRIAENLWGQSVLERLWDRMVNFDSTTSGTAQLVYKAHLRTYKVDNLRDIIGFGGPAYEALLKQLDMIRLYQSNEGMTLMDSNDTFEAHSYTFSGLPDVLLRFGEQLAGAIGIPLVRLFGQSPAGLNSTGESDFKMYFGNIGTQQESRLRPGVETAYHLMYRSKFGADPPKDFRLVFKPLWKMTPEEKAQVLDASTAAVTTAFQGGIINRGTALRELREQSRQTGVFSSITDEDITEADNEPPLTEMDSGTETDAGRNKPKGNGTSKANGGPAAH